MLPYKNPVLSNEERARDLLSRMTLREKIAQMQVRTNMHLSFSPDSFDREYPDGLGGACETGEMMPEKLNKMQRHMIENTRLGIPVLFLSESLHGLFCDGAAVFPQSIAMGSTFDPQLMEEVASFIGRESRAMGIRQTLAPNIDLSREPRWGRVEENYGEDPYLTSKMGAAYVRGLQSNGVAACLKHYTAHGSPEAGLNLAPVHAGERELRDTFLPPFAAAVRAGAMSVMPAYSELDGVPLHASRFLLTDVLRDELGFDGWTVSDWCGIQMLATMHHTADSRLNAGKAALHAGVDMEAPAPYGYAEEFIAAAERGEVNIHEIDTAVYRILLGKFRLGLFEQPYADGDGLLKLNLSDARALALRAAEKSCVLLKNDGTLPLKADMKIALIGPGADNTQLGDYTPSSAAKRAVSILSAMRRRLGDRLIYEKGCSIAFGSEEALSRAAQAAAQADAVVLVLSDNSSSFAGVGWGDDSLEGKPATTCGEGFDVHDLKFPACQEMLLDRILAVGKPTVLVSMTGRPRELLRADRDAAAIMQVWYPGQEGGEAVTRLLLGEANPSGRTPISFPRTTGHIPCFYNRKGSAQGYYHQPGSHEAPGRDYVFDRPGALYPFGHGLSYTTFEYSDLTVQQKGVLSFEASVTVKNTGSRAGEDIVLLFISDLCCRITPFVRQLKGFERISLAAGESVRVHFSLCADDLSFINERMKKEVEAGAFKASVGNLSVRFTVREGAVL